MPEPTKIPRAFAASGDKNSIPDSSGSPGFASWQEGFPAITSEPFAQGGIAPKRADFNGIFNALSLATVWQQQGGFYAYDNTTDYEVGNVVEYNNDLYKCITANGPGSAVKAPTDATVWSKVMTAADTAAAYLPLSGGTITGALSVTSTITTDSHLVFNDTSPVVSSGGADHYLRLGNGESSTIYNAGSSLYLYGASATSNQGGFIINAYDGTLRKQFEGSPDGTLTWDGNKVMTAADTAAAYLPLSGGTITGALSVTSTITTDSHLVFNNTSPVVSSGGADHYLRLGNGAPSTVYNAGSSLYLYGASATSNQGGFIINAYDGTLRKQFEGSPDGTLTWDGNKVMTAADVTFTVVTSSTVSVPASTDTNITSYKFTETGIYAAVYALVFRASGTSGVRQLAVSATSGGSNIDEAAVVVTNPPSEGYCFMQLPRLEKITTANTTRYLVAQQTTSSSMNVRGTIQVVRVGDA